MKAKEVESDRKNSSAGRGERRRGYGAKATEKNSSTGWSERRRSYGAKSITQVTIKSSMALHVQNHKASTWNESEECHWRKKTWSKVHASAYNRWRTEMGRQKHGNYISATEVFSWSQFMVTFYVSLSLCTDSLCSVLTDCTDIRCGETRVEKRSAEQVLPLHRIWIRSSSPLHAREVPYPDLPVQMSAWFDGHSLAKQEGLLV